MKGLSDMIVAVRAHPGAAVESVELATDHKLEIRVRARAIDGRANAALVEVLSRRLKLRPRQVRLIRGERSREKLFEIDLADLSELVDRLGDQSDRDARRW